VLHPTAKGNPFLELGSAIEVVEIMRMNSKQKEKAI